LQARAAIARPAACPASNGHQVLERRHEDKIIIGNGHASSSIQNLPQGGPKIKNAEAPLAELDSSIKNLNSKIKNPNGASTPSTEPDSSIKNQKSKFENLPLWPHPVDGATLLKEVAGRFSHYVVLPPGAAWALALWTAHAHAFAAFRLSPRLNLQSPERGCGKTTTLDVLASMVPRPVRTENLTAPTLFRLVDQFQPTLLLDEVDAYLHQAEELRGLLNAGHKRGACAYRCSADGSGLRAFKAFAPAVLSGIGTLPGTLHDRSVHIPLLKARPGEIAAIFDEENLEIENILAQKLARWTHDNFAALQSCRPPLPDTAHNRLADNWRPLFAIAEVAGGDCPALAFDAFTKLSARANLDAQGIGVLLLSDIREIFAESGRTCIHSKDLVAALCELVGGPCYYESSSLKDKPHKITEAWLARRLGRFGITARPIRIGDDRARGYEIAHFQEAFSRFLSATS
jgi:putative DNA primase/helicase